jgi:hypothetical protein
LSTPPWWPDPLPPLPELPLPELPLPELPEPELPLPELPLPDPELPDPELPEPARAGDLRKDARTRSPPASATSGCAASTKPETVRAEILLTKTVLNIARDPLVLAI